MDTPRSFSSFETSLKRDRPPHDWPLELKSLWFDAKADWPSAHRLVDQEVGSMAMAIHAYLHRKEGDAMNAAYWYRRAGRSTPELSLAEEHRLLVNEMIALQ